MTKETQTSKLRATQLIPQLARFSTVIPSIIVLPASCFWLCAILVATGMRLAICLLLMRSLGHPLRLLMDRHLHHLHVPAPRHAFLTPSQYLAFAKVSISVKSYL